MNAGNVLVTGGEGFDTVGGSSEGAASTLPEEEINPSDDTAEPAGDGAGDNTAEPAGDAAAE